MVYSKIALVQFLNDLISGKTKAPAGVLAISPTT